MAAGLAVIAPNTGFLPELISENPQLAHRGFYQTLEHPVTGALRYPLPPMRWSISLSIMKLTQLPLAQEPT